MAWASGDRGWKIESDSSPQHDKGAPEWDVPFESPKPFHRICAMKNWKDIFGGGIFVLLGLYVLVTAKSFGLGTAARMGGGYYPMILGAILMALGIAISLIGSRERGSPLSINFFPLVAVVAGLWCFVFLIDRIGIIPAIFILIFVASAADLERRWGGTAILAFIFSLVSWLLFSILLGLPIVGIRGLI